MTTSAKPFFDQATKQKMEVTRVFAVDLQSKLTRVRAKRLLKEGKATGMKPASEIAAADIAMQMLTYNNSVLPVRQASQVGREDGSEMPGDYLDPEDSQVGSDEDATSMFLDAHQAESQTTNPVKSLPKAMPDAVSYSSDNEGEGEGEGEGESADAPPDGHDALDFMDDVWGSSDSAGDESPMDSNSQESIIDDDMDELLGMVSKNADVKSGRSDESSSSGDDDAFLNLDFLDVKTNDKKIMSKDLTRLLKDIRG